MQDVAVSRTDVVDAGAYRDKKMIVGEPLPHDIKCGKNKTFVKHLGNVMFRKMLVEKKESTGLGSVEPESFFDRYNKAKRKSDKMAVTSEVVIQMQSRYGSRFVKPVKDGWQEISEMAARDKVSHALRFLQRNAEKAAKGGEDAKPTKPKLTKRMSNKRPAGESVESFSASELQSQCKRQKVVETKTYPLSESLKSVFNPTFLKRASSSLFSDTSSSCTSEFGLSQETSATTQHSLADLEPLSLVRATTSALLRAIAGATGPSEELFNENSQSTCSLLDDEEEDDDMPQPLSLVQATSSLLLRELQKADLSSLLV